jgi:hypothetical protein
MITLMLLLYFAVGSAAVIFLVTRAVPNFNPDEGGDWIGLVVMFCLWLAVIFILAADVLLARHLVCRDNRKRVSLMLAWEIDVGLRLPDGSEII